MLRFPFRPLSRSAPLNPLYRQWSSKTVIQEGDVVLLRRRRDPLADPILTLPLRSDRVIKPIRRALEIKGSLSHSSIIGKGVRDIVFTTKGQEFRLHEPSLAEYIVETPRLVTPIYPKEASLIVSLLDLHPTSYIEGDNKPPLEIFEAGTGHGSLTLQLSRAIHGANSQPPAIPPLAKKRQRPPKKPKVVENSLEQRDASIIGEVNISDDEQPGSTTTVASGSQTAEAPTDEIEGEMAYTEEMKAEYEKWLTTRRAIVQTLDISANYSQHAQQIVRSFRRGLYYPNINFHVGTIQEYLSGRLGQEEVPFLDHAILDLPQTEAYMEIVAKALKSNALLILYCPNITQINETVRLVKKMRLPFLLENVLEVGGSTATGGREWDVRMMKPRALLKAEAQEKQQPIIDEPGTPVDAELKDGHDKTEKRENEVENDEGWNVVCRPKAGIRTTVGAFVAVWRRMEPYVPLLSEEHERPVVPQPLHE